MEKKIIIVCEGKNDVSYLNALQRFVENDIPLPPGQLDPFLRFVPFPELEGTSQRLQPGVVFGEHLLQLFDEAYPGLIP